MSKASFANQIRAALTPLADAANAAPMRAYMKDQFPFLGIPTTQRRQAVAAALKSFDGDLLAAAQTLWALPEREYQYVACDLLRKYAKRLGPDDLAGLKHLVLAKSWWDTVDSLAVTVGSVLAQNPQTIGLMDEWIDADELWLKRVALLHQLAWKSQTHADRLFDYCLRRSADTDFFIRKAIGWALRQYAKENPTAVAQFVYANQTRLSGLSIREATKHISGQP